MQDTALYSTLLHSALALRSAQHFVQEGMVPIVPTKKEEEEEEPEVVAEPAEEAPEELPAASWSDEHGGDVRLIRTV